jgi:hypothetical protein
LTISIYFYRYARADFTILKMLTEDLEFDKRQLMKKAKRSTFQYLRRRT